MEKFLEKLFTAIHLRRFIVWILCLILILVCATGFFRNLNIDNSIAVWFSQDDQALADYQNYLQTFGSDRKLVLQMKAAPIGWESLIQLQKLSAKMEQIDGIDSIESIANASIISAQEGILSESHFDDWLSSGQDVSELLRQNPALQSFFSADKKYYFVYVSLLPNLDSLNTKKVISEIDKNKSSFDFVMTGLPVLDTHFNDLVWRDQLILFPASVIFAFIVFFWVVRNFRASLVLTVIQTMVLLVVLRLSQVLGYPLTIISGLACPLIVCVTVLNAAYLCQSFEVTFSGWALKVRQLLRPAIYTELTTVAGFMSFGLTTVPPLMHLSVLASIGILLALLAVLLLMPPLIGINQPPKNCLESKVDQKLKFFTKALCHFSIKNPRCVVAISSALLIFGVIGVQKISIQTRFENYFFSNDVIAKDWNQIIKKPEGQVDLLFSGDQNWFYEEQGYSFLKLNQEALRAMPVIKSIWSLQDEFDWAASLLGLSRDVKWDNSLIQQISLVLSSIRFQDHFVSPDMTQTRVQLSLNASTLESFYKEVHQLRGSLLQSVPANMKVSVTGYEYMLSLLHQHIELSQKQSLYISILLVSLMMLILTRHAILGLVSMIPNILPIVITLGLMGWLQIPLDVATILVAAIAVGVTVDDTIHFLDHFSHFYELSGNARDALEKTIDALGVIMSKSALVLTGGFLIFTLGSFKPTVLFGVLSAITFLLALVCEYLVTPALVFLTVRQKSQNQ